MERLLHGVAGRGLALGLVLCAAGVSRGQVAITEVMYNPSGDAALWEWLEVRNTTAVAVDLHGWVFDDDDDAPLSQFNISNLRGNTIVPAGGVAVLYAGDELDFDPQRFLDPWGSAITLIPINGLTSLGNEDAIGLWKSRSDYLLDAIPGATSSPRRNFTKAVASIRYSEAGGYPAAASGHSIAWSGSGDSADGSTWIQSEIDMLNAFESQQTIIETAQINSTNDMGNPGAVPASPTATGLKISEIMFAPESPLVNVGFTEGDFEWIELANRTAATIDFLAQPYVFDDIAGSKLSVPNITGGTIGAGEVGILFKEGVITRDDMEAIWGAGNYIPVASWPSLNNSGGDTIAIWDGIDAYDAEPVTGSGRTHQNAVAAVTYNTVGSQGWPTINDQSSIYLRSLTSNPNAGASWARAAAGDTGGSRRAQAIFQSAIDHPGGDVGSPGKAPGSMGPVLPGDYNNNGVVDAADYAVWRENLNSSNLLPNDSTAGSVTAADYDVWRANFGRTTAGGSRVENAAVPEPEGVVLASIIGAMCVVWRRVWRPRRVESCSPER